MLKRSPAAGVRFLRPRNLYAIGGIGPDSHGISFHTFHILTSHILIFTFSPTIVTPACFFCHVRSCLLTHIKSPSIQIVFHFSINSPFKPPCINSRNALNFCGAKKLRFISSVIEQNGI